MCLIAGSGFAQSRVEITASYWPVHTNGIIQASGTPIDLRSDLGVEQNVATFAGKLDLRLGRRQWIRVEGVPFRLTGQQDLSRTITYRGRVFSFADRVASDASLDYVYAGYQFDVISTPRVRFGLEAGGAYLNATGAIASQVTNLTASKSQKVGLPLAGASFRAVPIHGLVDVEIGGELKGMAVGRYGSFFQTGASVGVGRGHVFVEGGYRLIKADIHDAAGANTVAPTFRGPVISLYFRL